MLLSFMRGDLPLRQPFVLEVVADSQAARLGIQAGDILLQVGSQAAEPGASGPPLETVEQAVAALQAMPAGAVYSITLQRGGTRLTVAPTGGAPLGVRMVQGDLRPESPTRFPWTGDSETANGTGAMSEIERARWSDLPDLRQRDGNRLSLPVVRDGAGGRPHAELELALPRGSYLLHIPPGQGLCATRYPFEVARDLDWDEHCELPAADEMPPSLPAAPQPPDLGPGIGYWICIPAGPYRAAGDRDAQQQPPRDAAILRVSRGAGVAIEQSSADALPAEGFFVARFEVTSAMYLEFLNDRAWHDARGKDAFARVPRQALEPTSATAYWQRGPDGRIAMPAGAVWWTGDVRCLPFRGGTRRSTARG
ncbi:MAG: PDZ domain-containing protein [Microthrixaceae bacterium]|nr:PDZ domain-containing protein [Microthrixaceae bacterium]